MQHNTVRGALRGTTATLAMAAAIAGATSAATAAPLPLEPATATSETAPVAEEFTSTGSSTISASVNAKVACLFQRTFSAMRLDC
ncbi:hypothetical protein AB0H49_21560 [Nocardia sp. NPDC050713]|uniref:Uncharacterized protein n=3 Tax=Nocardia TaxID=1817 RepID=A0A285LUB2_9NOCA|nr:hypothetical protein [Nocardia amikacinitolerans]TQM31339.1 hypothetical protein FB390_2996 [Nocardia bhagyanarayanae]MCP2280730.1 hypothetical protein [Nocardia amikacinitolerans]MCP2287416.1 hypothetical protein [Nocardia amikacinitolerans]MCP2297303.1 hypothetical protein [Nocardia amikacinitolerans]MCP2317030.1 hypothetical protein [Nocardia amikacinitolerans]